MHVRVDYSLCLDPPDGVVNYVAWAKKYIEEGLTKQGITNLTIKDTYYGDFRNDSPPEKGAWQYRQVLDTELEFDMPDLDPKPEGKDAISDKMNAVRRVLVALGGHEDTDAMCINLGIIDGEDYFDYLWGDEG